MITGTSKPDLLNHHRAFVYLIPLLSIPALLLAACLPLTIASPSPSVSAALTVTPQAAALTATPAPTATTLNPNPADPTTGSTAVTPVLGEILPALLQSLLADLSARLGISINEVTVIQAQAVEWNDSSLGCPHPGVNYLQVITPGFRVRLYSQGVIYDYHTGARTGFILCGQVPAIEPVPLMPVAPHGKP